MLAKRKILAFLIGSLLIGHWVAAQRPDSISVLSLQPWDEENGTEKLFTELDAGAVGLGSFENIYSSPYVFEMRWREYLIGTIGTGLALGDIDGDRLPDVFLVSKDEQSRLYRNLGGMQFVDITGQSGILDSEDPGSGAAFVDVDNDGDLDLYLCFVAGSNQLWINDGEGHFIENAAEWGLAINTGSTMASFADFDRDGDLDLYLLTNLVHWENNTEKLADYLFENKGDRFEDITSSSGIFGAGNGHSALWWDYNEDGWPDIYVSNDFEDLDRLYRNNGDGTFTDVCSLVFPQVPFYSMGGDFGDVNNDGHSDYWVADMAASTREKHMRTMGNNWHVYLHESGDKTHQSVKNSLLLKLSESQFVDIAFLSGLAKSDWTWAARLADLNNDGRLDAFATNGMLRSFHDTDVITRGGFTTAEQLMSTAFLNEPILRETNFVYQNMGDLVFEEKGQKWGLDKYGVSFGAAFADLDLDGDLDIVLNNFKDPVSVYQNNEARSNRVTIRLKGTESNAYGIGAKVKLISGDLEQIKELAAMRGYMSSDEPILHFGLGTFSTIDRLEVTWPSGVFQLFEGLEANRHYEIKEASNRALTPVVAKRVTLFAPSSIELPDTTVRKEAYFSDFKRQELLPFRQSRLGGAVEIADLNGDGLNDLVLSGASGQETTVLVNQGGLAFEKVLSFDLEGDFGSEDRDIDLLDWDGDGDLDLWVSSGGVESELGDSFYNDRLYLNERGDDLVRDFEIKLSNLPSPSSSLAAADFDADGDTDVFSGGGYLPDRYPFTADSSLWINEGGEVFQAEDELAPSIKNLHRVADSAWADIDQDGDLDLLVVCEWGVPQLWENEGDSLSLNKSAISEELTGLWSRLSVEDLNNDGRLDIVVGNWGLNSDYIASVDEPIRLWYASDPLGRVKLIETYIKDDSEWIREEKWRMEKVFPREMRRMRSYQQYAEMTLQEVFPSLREDGFEYLEANELRSGVLWQQSDGAFVFEPLSDFAQSGRVEAILLEDVNHDGMKDILLSLDVATPEVWSERYEKGHFALLLNHGEKRFETILPWRSGLEVNGMPKGLAWGDLTGDQTPELCVFLSEGKPLIFSLSKEISP